MQSITLVHYFLIPPEALVSALDESGIWESLHDHIDTIERCERRHFEAQDGRRLKIIRVYPCYDWFPRIIARYLASRLPYQDTHFLLDRGTLTEKIDSAAAIGTGKGEAIYAADGSGGCRREIRLTFTVNTPILSSVIEKYFAKRMAKIYDTEAVLLSAWIKERFGTG